MNGSNMSVYEETLSKYETVMSNIYVLQETTLTRQPTFLCVKTRHSNKDCNLITFSCLS